LLIPYLFLLIEFWSFVVFCNFSAYSRSQAPNGHPTVAHTNYDISNVDFIFLKCRFISDNRTQHSSFLINEKHTCRVFLISVLLGRAPLAAATGQDPDHATPKKESVHVRVPSAQKTRALTCTCVRACCIGGADSGADVNCNRTHLKVGKGHCLLHKNDFETDTPKVWVHTTADAHCCTVSCPVGEFLSCVGLNLRPILQALASGTGAETVQKLLMEVGTTCIAEPRLVFFGQGAWGNRGNERQGRCASTRVEESKEKGRRASWRALYAEVIWATHDRVVSASPVRSFSGGITSAGRVAGVGETEDGLHPGPQEAAGQPHDHNNVFSHPLILLPPAPASLFTCMSFGVSVYLPVCPSVYLSPSDCLLDLSVCLPARLSTCLSACLLFCLPAGLPSA
jgi:hypothetical protein